MLNKPTENRHKLNAKDENLGELYEFEEKRNRDIIKAESNEWSSIGIGDARLANKETNENE